MTTDDTGRARLFDDRSSGAQEKIGPVAGERWQISDLSFQQLPLGMEALLYANADFGGAVVYVFNRDVGTGVITTARDDGSVGPTAPFPANVDDEVVISFELEAQFGSTCVRVAQGQSSSANECTP